VNVDYILWEPRVVSRPSSRMEGDQAAPIKYQVVVAMQFALRDGIVPGIYVRRPMPKKARVAGRILVRRLAGPARPHRHFWQRRPAMFIELMEDERRSPRIRASRSFKQMRKAGATGGGPGRICSSCRG